MTKLMISVHILPRVRPCRKYLGLDLEAVLDEGPGHRLVPGVPASASQPRLELLIVGVDPHEVEDELIGDDIDLDPSLAHGEVYSGHVNSLFLVMWCLVNSAQCSTSTIINGLIRNNQKL